MSSVSCDAKAPATVIHGSQLCDLRITPRNPANPRQCLLSGVFEKSTSYCYMPPMGGRTMPPTWGLRPRPPVGASLPALYGAAPPRCLSMQKGGTRAVGNPEAVHMPAQGLFWALWGLFRPVGRRRVIHGLERGGKAFPPFVSSAAKQACCYFDLAPSASTGDEGPRRGYGAARSASCLFLKHFSE